MDQGSIKIFPKSSKDVNLRSVNIDWKVRSIISRFKFSKSSKDHERVKDQSSIDSNFQNLRKMLSRVHERAHERVKDLSVKNIDARIFF